MHSHCEGLSVREAFYAACVLLGYVNDFGIANEDELCKKAVPVVNAVYADLYYLVGKGAFIPAKGLDDAIWLPARLLHDCLVYGVAMWLAQGESDGDQQLLFAEIYNRKRAGGASKGRIGDMFSSASSD